MEFSVHLSSVPDEWIPIKFIYFKNETSSNDIFLGDINDFRIRGYEVSLVHAYEESGHASMTNVTIRMCNLSIATTIQYRWLQTSQFSESYSSSPRELWILDDVEITFVTSENRITILNENFDCQELE